MSKTPQDWKRVKEGEALDLTILKVREDTVADPRDGSLHPRVMIEAPDWVNVIALTREGRVVLIRQFRFGIWQTTLEIPGGIVDPGEDPRTAAIRELEEETGYRAGQVVSLGWVHPNPAIQGNRCHSFLARDCVKIHEGQQEASEDIAVELRTREEIPGLILRGEISHALVVTAFYLEAQERR